MARETTYFIQCTPFYIIKDKTNHTLKLCVGIHRADASRLFDNNNIRSFQDYTSTWNISFSNDSIRHTSIKKYIHIIHGSAVSGDFVSDLDHDTKIEYIPNIENNIVPFAVTIEELIVKLYLLRHWLTIRKNNAILSGTAILASTANHYEVNFVKTIEHLSANGTNTKYMSWFNDLLNFVGECPFWEKHPPSTSRYNNLSFNLNSEKILNQLIDTTPLDILNYVVDAHILFRTEHEFDRTLDISYLKRITTFIDTWIYPHSYTELQRNPYYTTTQIDLIISESLNNFSAVKANSISFFKSL